jgi:hydroxymethylpyrimidine/phosphomethylpyrimidine kinase
LLDEHGVTALRERLMPRATLITPNVHELGLLLGESHAPKDVERLTRAAERLRAMGARAVLAKGGHLPGDPIDVLVDEQGVLVLEGARIDTTCTRGTGCTLSALITAGLARGATLRDAVRDARARLRRALERATPIGDGASPNDLFDDDAPA